MKDCKSCKVSKDFTCGERTEIICPKCGDRLWRMRDPEGKEWLFCFLCYDVEKRKSKQDRREIVA